MATLLLLSPALGVRARVTLPLSSLHPSIQQKKSAQKARRSLDGWRGVLDLGWQRRSGIPPAPLFPSHRSHPAGRCAVVLTRMSMSRLVVARGLTGGCHSSDPNPPWGPWEALGSPMGALCVQPEGWLSSCLTPAWLWEEEAVSFNCLGKLCLLLARGAGTGPSCARGAVWCMELALGER